MLNAWGPKIGGKAASYVWWSKLVVATGPVVVVLVLLIVGVSATAHLGNAGDIAWVVGIVAVTFGCSGTAALYLGRRLASKALGVRINGKNNPPTDRASYIAWCQKNHLTPFAAPTTKGRG